MNATRRDYRATAPRVFRDDVWTHSARNVVAEAPIAIVVDGAAEAVMMATPIDLEDFAFGFALTEGLIPTIDDVRQMEIVETAPSRHPKEESAYSGASAVEIRLWLKQSARTAHAARRRHRAGPAGCGLCGVESLEQAMRPLPAISSNLQIAAGDLVAAMRALAERQPLNQATRAAHAAALYRPERGLVSVREDIGRHNALDKLVGALARQHEDAHCGAVLVTSRLSVELVQKAAHIAAPILAAISAPSTLALDAAQACGLTVCGIVRDNGLEVFTHPERIA
jgi:FdhD protein